MFGTPGRMMVAAAGAAASGFQVGAVDFDGTNDYLWRNANITGITDSKLGLISVWLKPAVLTTAGNSIFRVHAGSTNRIAVSNWFADTDVILSVYASSPVITSNSGAIPTGQWSHLLYSWDNATGVRQLYRNDVSYVASSSGSNTTVLYTDVSGGAVTPSIGARGDIGALLYHGAMAEMYFTLPSAHFDLSVESNRRKFISAAGKPVDLGSTGSVPTGTTPLIYQHIDTGETPNNFALNAGSGGDFTVFGALSTAATSPSD